MLRRFSIAATLLAGLAASPTLAAGTADGGLEALKNYNLIVLGDFNAGHDVEGKTLVVGNLTGNGIFGIGSAANPTQGEGVSSAPTLTVGGNISNSSSSIDNGSNGGVGLVSTGSGIAVGGSVSNSTFNMNVGPRTWDIGGNYASKAEVHAGDVLNIGGSTTGVLEQFGGSATLGGSKAGGGNFNGGTFTQNQGGAFATSISTPITTKVSQVSEDIHVLATSLAALTLGSNPSTITFNSGALTLNAVGGGNDFALFNFTAASLGSVTDLIYNFSTTSLPVIVNVFGGTSLTLGFNSAAGNALNNQQVIWNFVDATSIDFAGDTFHGSVLAPNATVYNHTPIEGSVAVGNFVQGGEVHLGTYNGNSPFLTPAVPEPASWAMMIAGLGLVGGAMRRRASGGAIRFA